MSSLTMIEKRKLEDLLGSATGHVLDFTNATFADLFKTTCKVDIYDPKYAAYGESKGKRLRAFWELESDKTVGIVLREMLQFWELNQSRNNLDPNTQQLIDSAVVITRLLGGMVESPDMEEAFLKLQFEKISLKAVDVEPAVISLLEIRLDEAVRCRKAGAFLSTIFMCGSILEGLLLGTATKNPKEFNQANASPKHDGKVKPFHDWKLSELIDVAHEVGILSLDVKKFSHALRDFRNYIHPYSQMASGFIPNEHTADICLQVLKAAIASLNSGRAGKGTV